MERFNACFFAPTEAKVRKDANANRPLRSGWTQKVRSHDLGAEADWSFRRHQENLLMEASLL